MNLVKKLNDYFNLIEESINSPREITWENLENSLIGYFYIDNIKYRIECLNQIGNNYSYSFSYLNNNKWKYELSNLGTSGFSVLSTISIGVDYLQNKYNPNSIIFSAIDDSDVRKRLYEKKCKQFCDKYNYKLSNRGNDDKIIFVLFKDNISISEKEEIFNSVKKVIEQGK